MLLVSVFVYVWVLMLMCILGFYMTSYGACQVAQNTPHQSMHSLKQSDSERDLDGKMNVPPDTKKPAPAVISRSKCLRSTPEQ